MSLEATQYPLEAEYKKNTGITPADISKLRAWLKTQPHLPEEHITDLDLVLAYHSCSCSSEVTKQVIDLHYTLRTLFSNLFKDRDAADKRTASAMQTVIMLPLETRAYDGSAAIYCCLHDNDVKNFVFADCIRLVMMVIDLWQFEEGTWPGFYLLIDMKPVTLAHLSKLDFQTLQQLFYFLQEAMLLKVKGLHFLNAPSFMDRLMFLLKPFMKKDLLDVLYIHTGDTLKDHMPLEALPKDAGGQYKSIEQGVADMKAKITANQKFFQMENKRRVTESRRPGKPKTITDIFGGIEGSFKKLDID